MALPGTLADDLGTEVVSWSIADSLRPGWNGRYEITADIRGVHVTGADFTGLEPDSPTDALPLNQAGEISDCDLTVQVPVKTRREEPAAGDHLHLTFHLGTGRYESVVDATLTLRGTSITVSQEERLEELLGAVARQFVGGPAWECCLTCGLSDYNPGGNGNMGMRCHRDARSEYLSAHGKWEYWRVPVTEEVPEFYWCTFWEARQPGTGYRG